MSWRSQATAWGHGRSELISNLRDRQGPLPQRGGAQGPVRANQLRPALVVARSPGRLEVDDHVRARSGMDVVAERRLAQALPGGRDDPHGEPTGCATPRVARPWPL